MTDRLIEGGTHSRPRSLSVWRWLAANVGGLGLALGFAAPAFAHDGGPGIIVQPAIVVPGGVVNVRGDNLWTDAEVRVTLLDPSGARTPLVDGMTDGEAHLDLVVTLPSSLPAGSYEVEVANAAGERVTASLLVGDPSPSGYLIGLLAIGAAGLLVAAALAVRSRRHSHSSSQ